MESKRSRKVDALDEICRSIVVALIRHRSVMNCDCDLENITRGGTQKNSNICEIRDQTVLEAVKRHNKICTCRVFQLEEQEKEESRPSKPTLRRGFKKAFRTSATEKTPLLT
jgi:hypothetical protein